MRQSTPASTDEDSEDDDREFLEPNRSLDVGRKSAATFYGDDPDADPSDSNLSALFAEMGTEERLGELGM
ncbi:MAG TPA: hypothetical protein VHO02_06510 [Fibrobacteria bacterium]|nr:hypothetical protein [Fibrobacteria bacterium]